MLTRIYLPNPGDELKTHVNINSEQVVKTSSTVLVWFIKLKFCKRFAISNPPRVGFLQLAGVSMILPWLQTLTYLAAIKEADDERTI